MSGWYYDIHSLTEMNITNYFDFVKMSLSALGQDETYASEATDLL